MNTVSNVNRAVFESSDCIIPLGKVISGHVTAKDDQGIATELVLTLVLNGFSQQVKLTGSNISSFARVYDAYCVAKENGNAFSPLVLVPENQGSVTEPETEVQSSDQDTDKS